MDTMIDVWAAKRTRLVDLATIEPGQRRGQLVAARHLARFLVEHCASSEVELVMARVLAAVNWNEEMTPEVRAKWLDRAWMALGSMAAELADEEVVGG